MRSPLRTLSAAVRNQTKPPIPLSTSNRYQRGLSFNLGAGRQDRETYLRQYGMSGTLYGIVSLLAEAAATPTWRLYKKPPRDGRVRYATGDQGSDQRIEILQHAAIQLVNSPNDFHSGFEFREGCQQHEELTGETFWVLDIEAGFPTSMWYVRPDRMEPVPDPDEYLVGWIYTGPSGEQVPLRRDEVILEKRPDPLDPYRGAGPVAAITPNIQQQRYATEYQRNLFLNGADPGGIITVPTKLHEREFDELIDRWRESHRGVARAGHVGVLEDGAQWQPSAHTNKDLEYGNLRLANRDELREAWRIHKAMMGTADDVNRANAVTAEEVFVAWQVIPRLNRRRDTLNSKLLPLFARADKTCEFDYEDPSPVNAESAALELSEKAKAAQALVAAGYEPHDVLETVGLPDMDVVEQATQAPAVPPGWVPAPPAEPAPASPAGAPAARERVTLRAAAKDAPDHDLSQVDAQWKKAVAALTAAYLAQVIPAQRRQLTDQIRALVAAGDLALLAALKVDSTEGAQLLLAAMTDLAAAAAKQAAAEARQQGARTVTPQQLSQDALSAVAESTAAITAAQLALSAGGEATRLAGGDGADGRIVAAQVAAFLEELSTAYLTGRLAGALSAAQNEARIATFLSGPSADLYASEMLDGNTCQPCSKINGTFLGNTADAGIDAEIDAVYPGGGYVNCDGGDRCRGTVIADYTAARTAAQAGGDMAERLRRVLSNGYQPMEVGPR